MKPNKRKCRWLDRYFGDVCRNQATHPPRIMFGGAVCFVEPPCHPCDKCGYQPITPETPAWDDPGEDTKEETK